MSTTKTECKIALPVHANRTNFKHNDLLVPWKRQTDSNSFHRFYHVFEKGMYSNSAHSNLEVVKNCPNKSDNKFMKYCQQTTIYH